MILDPIIDRADRALRLLERLVAAAEAGARPSESPTLGAEAELWDAHQVAKYLGCSVSKVRQHAAAGKIPTVPGIGRQLRFDPAEVRRAAHGEKPATGGVVHINRNRG